MIGLLIYLFIAKMQDSYADRSAAWHWALGLTLINSVFSLMSTPLMQVPMVRQSFSCMHTGTLRCYAVLPATCCFG